MVLELKRQLRQYRDTGTGRGTGTGTDTETGTDIDCILKRLRHRVYST